MLRALPATRKAFLPEAEDDPAAGYPTRITIACL
jgi:hypothetical protein